MPNNRRLLGLTGADGQVLTAHPGRDLLGDWEAAGTGGGGGPSAPSSTYAYLASSTAVPASGQITGNGPSWNNTFTLNISKTDSSGNASDVADLSTAQPNWNLSLQNTAAPDDWEQWQLQAFPADNGTYLTFSSLAPSGGGPTIPGDKASVQVSLQQVEIVPALGSNVVGPGAFGDPPVVGTSPYYAADDHYHGLPPAPSGGGGPPPATTVAGPDAYGAASVVGTGTDYARNDHRHGLPAAPTVPGPATTVTGPPAFNSPAAVGTGTLYARNDHAHGLPAQLVSANLVVGPGTFGQVPAVGSSGAYARQDHFHGLPTPTAPPSPATTVTGPDAFGAPAVVGTGTTYARVDHDHGLPAAPAVPGAATTVAGPEAYSTAGVVGSSTLYARGDHLHGLTGAYFPPQAPPPTGRNTITDASGEVWISVSGSAWKRARDACRVRAWNNAAQTFATGANTTIVYTTLDSGTGDFCGSLNLGTGTYTAPVAGVYRVDGRVYAAVSGTPGGGFAVYTALFRNGAVFVRGAQQRLQVLNEYTESVISDQVHLAAGDTLVMVLFQNTGVNMTMPAGFVELLTFAVHYLSPG